MSMPRWIIHPKLGRRPQSLKKVPFKEEWPLVLENFVSTRKVQQKEIPCINETLAFITCLKDNNNIHELCLPQAEAVQNCHATFLRNRKESEKEKRQGDFVPEISVKNMNPAQINKFLSHFPHVVKKK